MSYSPAQMLMSRVLNSKIPILPALLEPKVVDPRPQLEQRQRRHKAVFDRGARELPKLQAGEKVRMRRNHVWMPATVVREDGHPRSYIVKRSGTEYRRNRPRVAILPDHGCWHPHMIAAHANFLTVFTCRYIGVLTFVVARLRWHAYCLTVMTTFLPRLRCVN